ncbi:MAG: chromate transporter [Bacteroidales bacterium]|nr:chromate transporter [Bacteroidales bacterium]
MIFLRLFFSFLRIGIFSFGGGLAMIALIQNEVVVKQGWLTAQEFTDVVATSQITPGPVGINTATYVGYTAVVNAGYSQGLGIAGAFLASFAVILIPLILTLLVSRFLLKHKDNPIIANIMYVLRLTIVGLIAAAALLMVTPDTFGTLKDVPMQFIASVVIFLAVFVASFKFKTSPILLILLSGATGALIYGLLPLAVGC